MKQLLYRIAGAIGKAYGFVHGYILAHEIHRCCVLNDWHNRSQIKEFILSVIWQINNGKYAVPNEMELYDKDGEKE